MRRSEPSPQSGSVIRGVQLRLILGFGSLVALILMTGATALYILQVTISREDAASLTLAENLVEAERLRFQAEFMVAASRGYLLTGHQEFRRHFRDARREFLAQAGALRLRCTSAQAVLLDDMVGDGQQYIMLADEAARHRTPDSRPEEVLAFFERVLGPARTLFRSKVDDFVHQERDAFQVESDRIHSVVRRAALAAVGVALLAAVLGSGLGIGVSRRLVRNFRTEEAAVLTARQAVAAREEIVAIASHDLRAPLGVILMSQSFAMRRLSQESDDLRAPMEAIGRAAKSMLQLIEDVLETSRIDAGAVALRLEACHMEDLVQAAIDVLEAPALARGVRLARVVQGGSAIVRVDRSRLVRVLTNVIGNAVKFSPAGGEVVIELRREDGTMRCSVQDRGPGIATEHLPLLFERHWQAHRSGSGGLGLGLYIARNLVELHGGTLHVESTLGAGSTFFFTLPCEETPPPAG